MFAASPSAPPLFYTLVALWVVSEFWLQFRRRAARVGAQRRDRGSLRLISVLLYAGVFLAVWSTHRAYWPFPPSLRAPLFWIGLALMAAGIAFRWWAIRVLAKFFTVDVAVHADHKLVQDGPYRWLRHPSYTGSLLTFLGFGLALGNGISLLAAVLPVIVSFAYRIHVEEQALTSAFPDEYPAYAARTKRLLPFVW
ncbi:phosphatidylethanolamine N-methyltransferase family protein [Pseudoxanthomonas sangjuensis]|nr:protein-S-isoprenylcysteine methyltransferase [Pseudoxanthomonas sangjuensis]